MAGSLGGWISGFGLCEDSLWDLIWLSESILSLQGHKSSKAMMLDAMLSHLATERDV